MNGLSDEEIEVLKEVVKREQAASLIWKWIRALLMVAVPIATLYSLYKASGGQP